jgi:hypothetical protein
MPEDSARRRLAHRALQRDAPLSDSTAGLHANHIFYRGRWTRRERWSHDAAQFAAGAGRSLAVLING